MKNARPTVWALVIVVVVLAALNAMLLREVLGRRASGIPVQDATEAARKAPDSPGHRVYFVFSPARCPATFVPQLQSWPSLFQRFHGPDVWMEAVAVDTSEGELGRFWEALGLKLAVTLDRDKSLVRRYGIKAIPAKLVVEKGGAVVYREEYPELYDNDVLARVLAEVAGPAAGVRPERREP